MLGLFCLLYCFMFVNFKANKDTPTQEAEISPYTPVPRSSPR